MYSFVYVKILLLSFRKCVYLSVLSVTVPQCDAWYTVVGLLVRQDFLKFLPWLKSTVLLCPLVDWMYNFTCLFSDSHPRKLGQKQYRYLSSMIWLNQQECYISAAPAKATVTVLSKTHHVLFVPWSSCLCIPTVDKALFIL